MTVGARSGTESESSLWAIAPGVRTGDIRNGGPELPHGEGQGHGETEIRLRGRIAPRRVCGEHGGHPGSYIDPGAVRAATHHHAGRDERCRCQDVRELVRRP
jgi:hypothetical protein